jgi:hypothetical protein
MIVSSGITLRGTAAEFVQANPILKPGQIGYETETGLFKTGNGKTAWNSFTKYSADQGPKGQKGDTGEVGAGYNLLNATTALIDPTTEEEVSPIAKIPTSPYSKIKVYADVDEYAYSIGDTVKLKNVYDVEEVNPVLSASATSITALNSDVTSGLATFTLSEPISAYVNQYITLTDANESGWVLSPCQISTISGTEIEVYYNTSISPESSTFTSDWIVERDIFNSPLPAYYNSFRDVIGIISGAGSNSYTIDIMSTAASSLWESDTCNIGLAGLDGLYGPAGLTGDPGPKGDDGDPGAPANIQNLKFTLNPFVNPSDFGSNGYWTNSTTSSASYVQQADPLDFSIYTQDAFVIEKTSATSSIEIDFDLVLNLDYYQIYGAGGES